MVGARKYSTPSAQPWLSPLRRPRLYTATRQSRRARRVASSHTTTSTPPDREGKSLCPIIASLMGLSVLQQPSPRSITKGVFSISLTSPHREAFSMYSMSSSTHSAKDTAFRSVRTCQRQVRPGFTISRRLW